MSNSFPISEPELLNLVDAELLAAATNMGVPITKGASCQDGCIATAYDHLHLHATNIRVGGQEGERVAAVVELGVVVRDPKGYGGFIHHLAGGQGTTLEEAIRDNCQTLIRDLMPPLCYLFGAQHGPQQPVLKVSSITEGRSKSMQWECICGPIQALGDDNLLPALKKMPPIALVLDTVTEYLAEDRLHWIKFFGVRHHNGETEFTVAINNEIDVRGHVEAHTKWKWADFPNPCQFRQFMLLRPVGTMNLNDDPLLGPKMGKAPGTPKRFNFWRKH